MAVNVQNILECINFQRKGQSIIIAWTKRCPFTYKRRNDMKRDVTSVELKLITNKNILFWFSLYNVYTVYTEEKHYSFYVILIGYKILYIKQLNWLI